MRRLFGETPRPMPLRFRVTEYRVSATHVLCCTEICRTSMSTDVFDARNSSRANVRRRPDLSSWKPERKTLYLTHSTATYRMHIALAAIDVRGKLDHWT